MKWFKWVVVASTLLLNLVIVEPAMASRKRNAIERMLAEVASEVGVGLNALRAIIGIESNFNPRARTGSYKGLGQLSTKEFKHWGGGNIYNARDNAMATARKYKAESSYIRNNFGIEPTPGDIYLVHQQGRGGYAQHTAQPDRAAWESMYATREGQQKGKRWAKRAIWGNLPPSEKRRFGNVNNVTSRDFTNFWKARVERGMGVETSDVQAGPPIPERAMGAMPTMRSAELDTSAGDPGNTQSPISTLPGRSESGILPVSRREVGAKFQYRAPEMTQPPLPERSARAELPGRRPLQRFSMPVSAPGEVRQVGAGTPGISGTPGVNPANASRDFGPDFANQAFGDQFGSLFADSRGVPGPVPTMSDFVYGPTPRITPDLSNPSFGSLRWWGQFGG